MHASGYVTHSSLQDIGLDALEFVGSLFAEGLETYRQRRGIPLDLVVAAVVAEKPRA